MTNFALVLTGHMRCWEKVFPNTKMQFLDKFNPDVFISTWDDEGYWVSPERDPENAGIRTESPKLDIRAVQEAYSPVSMEVDNFGVIRPEFQELSDRLLPLCDQIRPMNIVSQFYKIRRGYSMMEDHVMKTGKKYDWVIRMRPDLIITGDFISGPQELNTWVGNEVLTLYHTNHRGTGVGDMFLLTNYTYSVLFSSLLTLYPLMAEAAGVFCPHILTGKLVDGLPEHQHINMGVDKTIMHTPKGQYKDA